MFQLLDSTDEKLKIFLVNIINSNKQFQDHEITSAQHTKIWECSSCSTEEKML